MNWFCVHTKPLKEAPAATYCREALGVETYFPRLRREKLVRRVRQVVCSPLFPRYFFSRLDVASQFRAVRFAPDVLDIVSFGGRPAIVGDEIIAGLRAWAGEALDLISIQPALRPGDLVQVTAGPLRGLQAVIMEENPKTDRVAVLLSILSCGARTIVDRAHVERVA